MAKKTDEFTRRDFLKQSAAGAVGAMVGPYIARDAFAACSRAARPGTDQRASDSNG
jgi:hypothetical protein